MIYLNANRSAAYRWDGRAHQFEFFFFGGAGRWVKRSLPSRGAWIEMSSGRENK